LERPPQVAFSFGKFRSGGACHRGSRRKRILPALGRKTTADYGMGLVPIFFSFFWCLFFGD